MESRTLGDQLRGIRARKRWKLKEMSQHSGIPLSTLTKIEHDRLSLSWEKLLQVSRLLSIPLQELLPDCASEPKALEVTGRRSLGSISTAVHVPARNYDCYYMCPELRDKKMVP